MHVNLENAGLRKGFFTTSFVNFLKTLGSTDTKGFLFCFAFGFAVRMTPVILAYPFPIGYDTINYAAAIKNGITLNDWASMFSPWLFYAMLLPFYRFFGVDPFSLLSLAGPLLYGFNVLGIYYFARKWLDWVGQKALMAAVFFAFQLASLRMSWDLHRNMLGLAVLLFALPQIRFVNEKKRLALFCLLSLLVVFSHQAVAFVMFAAVSWIIFSKLLKGEKTVSLRIFLALLPALSLFLTQAYSTQFAIRSDVGQNVIRTAQPPVRLGGLFFLTSYYDGSAITYLNIVAQVLTLFAVLYALSLPMVFVGFFGNKLLEGWTVTLLFGSFGLLATPFCALLSWQRWMFMLVYPFTFYAVEGVERTLRSNVNCGSTLNPGRIKLSTKWLLGLCSLMLLFASLFVAFPLIDGRSGVFSLPTTLQYFPSTMQHNTIPLQDVDGTVEALKWLNDHVNAHSSILVNPYFLSWAYLVLNKSCAIVLYDSDVDDALTSALQNGANSVYLISWNEEVWEPSVAVPSCFRPAVNSGRISVFEYQASSV